MQKIFKIKNMVCDRCILSVNAILKEMKIDVVSTTLGTVELNESLSDSRISEFDQKLRKIGFEIITENKSILIEEIKNNIIELIYQEPEIIEKTNISNYLKDKLNKDYSFLSNLFSKKTGVTIEKFFILQKIERVKELLSYNDQNINEIAFLLGYKSSQHLSSQFKKITGFSPSAYKKQAQNRKPLDKV